MPIADNFTVDDLVVKSANDLFTDREEPRKAFWDVYNSMVPGEYTAIAYYGVGGIGKTTLLKKLAQEMDERIPKSRGLDHITYSFEDYTSKEVFLFNLSRQMRLRNKDLDFPIFDEAIAKICREGNRDIEKLKADTVASFSEMPLIDTALSFFGEFIEGVDPATKITERVVELTNNLIGAYERKYGKNAVLYNQIAYSDNKTLINDYLHEYFIYDASEAMKKRTRPLVIFLDGYEKYVDSLNDAELTVGKDNWIHFVKKRLVNIPNTLWVVAGREKIKWKEDVLPAERLHRIGNLSEIDTTEYFGKAGITEGTLISQLYELCHGTPVYMDLCVRTYAEISKMRVPVIGDFGQDTSELARRYLEFMDKPTRRLLELISWLPNVWTKKMVTDIAQQVNYDLYLPELNTILNLSLIEPIDLGYKLHETCRVVARNVCDNSELIQNGVVGYLKNKVLAPDDKDDKFYVLVQLMDVLAFSDKVTIVEEDFSGLLDAYESKSNYIVNYQENVKLSERLYSYAIKSNFSAKTRVRCGNINITALVDLGQYEVAHELAIQNYEYAKENLQKESDERLGALSMLASTYSHLEDHGKAKELYEECYQIRNQILGEEHPDTLSSLNCLANEYGSMSDYIKAQELLEECYTTSKRVLGEEHLSTIHYLNNLMVNSSPSEINSEAKGIFEKCYEISKRVLGENHPATLAYLTNLATSYANIKSYGVAKELYEKSYEISKQVFGEGHPNTLEVNYKFALVCFIDHDYNKSKELDVEYYETSKRVWGIEHPNTFAALHRLAIKYGYLCDYVKQKEIREEYYETKKRLLGEEHPETLDSLFYLVQAYEDLGDFNTALNLAEKGYEISKRTISEADYGTQSVIDISWQKQDAYRWEMGIYQYCIKLFGEMHPRTVEVKARLELRKPSEMRHEIVLPHVVKSISSSTMIRELNGECGEQTQVWEMIEILNQEVCHFITKPKTYLGKSIDMDICILNPAVSRQHARIELEEDGIVIRDLKSTNGTFWNGKRVDYVKVLNDEEGVLKLANKEFFVRKKEN